MANEIQASASLSAVKGGVDVQQSTSVAFDMAGEDMIDCTQTIPVTAVVAAIGAIAVPPAYLQLKNLDPTNYVQVATDSNFNANEIFAVIRPGRHIQISPIGSVWMKAANANCKVALCAVEA